MKVQKISPVIFVVLGVVLGLFAFFLILANPFGWKIPVPTLKPQIKTDRLPASPTTAPTPYLFLPHGKQTYNAQGGNKVSNVTSITFDPLDPAQNTFQTITATVKSAENINSVSLTLNTDNKTNTYPMSLTSTEGASSVWTVKLEIQDTYEKVYNISFQIITNLGHKTTQPMLIR